MTPRSLILIAGMAFALVSCDGLMKSDADQGPAAQAKRAPVDVEAQMEADIMVGRVEVMQDQTVHGMEVLGVARPALVELPTDRDTFRRLSDAVVRFNELNKAACAGGVATGSLCPQAPYLPLWYAGRARPDTSPAGLKTAAEGMQNQMIPLWETVCAKAKAKTGDEHFCAIE